MEKLVGRMLEKMVLEGALATPGAELITVYGRCRIGKTFLIRSVSQALNIYKEFMKIYNSIRIFSAIAKPSCITFFLI